MRKLCFKLIILIVSFYVLTFLWHSFALAIPEYSITDLGIDRAYSINESGAVVGIKYTDGRTNPFIWTQEEGKVEIPTIGGSEGWALDINKFGQVVGYTEGEQNRAFIWSETTGMQELPGGVTYSAAIAINDLGQVVGEIDGQPVLWTNEMEVMNIGMLSGAALDINNFGTILIHTEDDRAFFWNEEGGMQELPSLGGEGSTARKVNSTGQIVGWSQTPTGNSHAFLWTEDGGIEDLDTLGGPQSIALNINNRGQIVGHSDISPSFEHAFLWQNSTGLQDLNKLKPESFSDVLEAAYDINDTGQIIGNTTRSAFIMSPSWDAIVTEDQSYMTDYLTLGDTFSFDAWWEMGQEPENKNFDLLFFHSGEWKFLGWDINFDGSSTEWETLSFWVPQWARGLETQIKFVLADWCEITDPTVYLRNIQSNPVPEPSTILLLGSGLIGLAGWGRRKFKK